MTVASVRRYGRYGGRDVDVGTVVRESSLTLTMTKKRIRKQQKRLSNTEKLQRQKSSRLKAFLLARSIVDNDITS